MGRKNVNKSIDIELQILYYNFFFGSTIGNISIEVLFRGRIGISLCYLPKLKTEIMPRRKTDFGYRTRHSERTRRRLLNMTEEERASVRERNRLNIMQMRNAETAERRAARLKDARLRIRQWRSTVSFRSQQNERERATSRLKCFFVVALVFHCAIRQN